eukprot:4684613-Alexandrium_andersonii.AAC.1
MSPASPACTRIVCRSQDAALSCKTLCASAWSPLRRSGSSWAGPFQAWLGAQGLVTSRTSWGG